MKMERLKDMKPKECNFWKVAANLHMKYEPKELNLVELAFDSCDFIMIDRNYRGALEPES